MVPFMLTKASPDCQFGEPLLPSHTGPDQQAEGGSGPTLRLPLFQQQPRRKQGLYGCHKYFIPHVLQSTTAECAGLLSELEDS